MTRTASEKTTRAAGIARHASRRTLAAVVVAGSLFLASLGAPCPMLAAAAAERPGSTAPAKKIELVTFTDIINPIPFEALRKDPGLQYRQYEISIQMKPGPDGPVRGEIITKHYFGGAVYYLPPNIINPKDTYDRDSQYINSVTFFDEKTGEEIKGQKVVDKLNGNVGINLTTDRWENWTGNLVIMKIDYTRTSDKGNSIGTNFTAQPLSLTQDRQLTSFPSMTAERPSFLNPNDPYYDKDFIETARKQGFDLINDPQWKNASYEERVLELIRRFKATVVYKALPGPLDVNDRNSKVLQGRGGVCVDFTNAFIGLCYLNQIPYRGSPGFRGEFSKLINDHVWPDIDGGKLGVISADFTEKGNNLAEFLTQTKDSPRFNFLRGGAMSFNIDGGEVCRGSALSPGFIYYAYTGANKYFDRETIFPSYFAFKEIK